jgi:ketosteroid isomerase-like protein
MWTNVTGLILASAVLLAVAYSTPAMQRSARDELEETDQRLGAAWSARRLDELTGFYARDVVAMWSDEPVREGTDAIREMWRTRWADSGFRIVDGTRTHFEVAASGDLAYMQGRSTFEWTRDGGRRRATGSWVIIWRRGSDGWRIASEVWTKIRDEAR